MAANKVLENALKIKKMTKFSYNNRTENTHTWKFLENIFFSKYTLNSIIFARVYFRETSRLPVMFHENENLAKWRNHSTNY